MDTEISHQTSPPLSRRRRLLKRTVALLAILLLLYLFAAYVVFPALWSRYVHHHPAMDDVPNITQTANGIPGDPLNVALIGTEKQLKTIMIAAHWYPADPLTFRSCLEIAEASVLKRPYDDAPVSSLYLFGRKEDLAFEQPVGDNPRHRHHVRFWRAPKAADDGRPVWVGSAIFDKRVGFSRTTGQVTHVTAPNIDTERDYLFNCLERTGDLSENYTVDHFHQVLKGRNGGGDPWETDGRLLVGIIASAPSTSEKSVKKPEIAQKAFVGSKTCQDCHAEFYKLWSTSWHGLAMQPYSAKFAQSQLTPQTGEVTIGQNRYSADISGSSGCVREVGPGGERKFDIAHVMGGKNVYYFLAPLERGRLQVLPLAYDVHKKTWYDMAASGVRHFPDRRDEALHWTDRMFSFNSTCFNCHVTELATNYDLATDTYHTTWSEPGISCESCHGSAKEHVRVMEEDSDEQTVKDIKIIRTKKFSALQMNDMCATCHAKMVPLSLSFLPGEKFFDHFDLLTWEHADFYPDGRDLGENYTYTSWLASPCLKSDKMDCNHCHTASGRMRYVGEESNRSCLPCHEQLVKDPVPHGHHAAGSKGNECVACHMPMTRFAAMGRTDHSMRPPTPATTIAFQSPNACNLCHTDHNATWSDEWVRKWYQKDYQKEPLRRAELIDAARKREWNRLPEMFADLKKDGDQVYKTSLLRLLAGCNDEKKWPVLVELLKDSSPLVRSSAASALGSRLTPDVLEPLLAATADPSRLVRIRAAMSLSALPPKSMQDERTRTNLEKANREFIDAMHARPDDWASHANLGNFYMESRDFSTAVKCFETATQLEPRQVGPLVNASMAYSNMGQNEEAEKCLRRALKLEPTSAAANFNLGLLLGEKGQMAEAEQSLRAALKADPRMAAAAYNLSVILGEKNLDEAITWCQKSHELAPSESKYAHSLAFFLHQKGKTEDAIFLLRQVIQREPAYIDAYGLLSEIYESQHDYSAAAAVYRDALKIKQLPPPLRQQLEIKVREAESK
jgi:tetratricopeptide (TPR) repeat protein